MQAAQNVSRRDITNIEGHRHEPTRNVTEAPPSDLPDRRGPRHPRHHRDSLYALPAHQPQELEPCPSAQGTRSRSHQAFAARRATFEVNIHIPCAPPYLSRIPSATFSNWPDAQRGTRTREPDRNAAQDDGLGCATRNRRRRDRGPDPGRTIRAKVRPDARYVRRRSSAAANSQSGPCTTDQTSMAQAVQPFPKSYVLHSPGFRYGRS